MAISVLVPRLFYPAAATLERHYQTISIFYNATFSRRKTENKITHRQISGTYYFSNGIKFNKNLSVSYKKSL
jgi:hypothetical protein